MPHTKHGRTSFEESKPPQLKPNDDSLPSQKNLPGPRDRGPALGCGQQRKAVLQSAQKVSCKLRSLDPLLACFERAPGASTNSRKAFGAWIGCSSIEGVVAPKTHQVSKTCTVQRRGHTWRLPKCMTTVEDMASGKHHCSRPNAGLLTCRPSLGRALEVRRRSEDLPTRFI